MNISEIDPAVQSAAIQSIGAMVAAFIAAITATLIGKNYINKKALQEKLVLAQRDIEFLLAVEEEHCALHVEHTGESYKNRVRRVAKERNYVWSGKFTPGRANDSATLQSAKRAVQ